MSASTAPAAKAQLITLFQAWAPLSGVAVTWGSPSKESDVKREHIWLGDVDEDQDWHALGNKKKREDYTIEVIARVIREGDDERATEVRCWAIVAEIENALRSDPGLASSFATGWAQVAHTNMQSHPAEPQAWVSRANLTVACTALI